MEYIASGSEKVKGVCNDEDLISLWLSTDLFTIYFWWDSSNQTDFQTFNKNKLVNIAKPAQKTTDINLNAVSLIYHIWLTPRASVLPQSGLA